MPTSTWSSDTLLETSCLQLCYNFNRGFLGHSFLTALDSLKKNQDPQHMGICAKLITIRDARKEGKKIIVFPENRL